MAYNFLIVGAGITGATAARLLLDAGKSVLVIDRRKVIAGNCHDSNRDGIMVNSYAGHIFHTNSARVWKFMQRFAEWRQYEHRVKAKIEQKVYSFPPNLMTLQQLDLKPDSELSKAIIENLFFKGYSEKHWGRPWEDVPASAKKRMSIRNTWDDRYFTDIYQGLPEGGYTKMIDSMLSGAALELEADYLKDDDYWNQKAAQIIYTGSLDEYYRYDLGQLEYRSSRFDTIATNNCESLLGCATMNYPSALLPYTREMEWKHFGYQKADFTIVTREFPEAYDGLNERLWPVETEANRALYDKYRERVNANWFHVAGRLGEYRYYNMDQAVAAAMQLVEKVTHREKEYA